MVLVVVLVVVLSTCNTYLITVGHYKQLLTGGCTPHDTNAICCTQVWHFNITKGPNPNIAIQQYIAIFLKVICNMVFTHIVASLPGAKQYLNQTEEEEFFKYIRSYCRKDKFLEKYTNKSKTVQKKLQ